MRLDNAVDDIVLSTEIKGSLEWNLVVDQLNSSELVGHVGQEGDLESVVKGHVVIHHTKSHVEVSEAHDHLHLGFRAEFVLEHWHLVGEGTGGELEVGSIEEGVELLLIEVELTDLRAGEGLHHASG